MGAWIETVDGERYALVWSQDGNFDGFTVSGEAVDANDKVFRVVDMYHSGIWDLERALEEIKVYPTYDQIAFITQRAIDNLLKFKSSEEV